MKGCYKLSLTQNWVPMSAFLRNIYIYIYIYIFFFFHIINLLLINSHAGFLTF